MQVAGSLALPLQVAGSLALPLQVAATAPGSSLRSWGGMLLRNNLKKGEKNADKFH
ncbi:MAG: hypothetical protein ACI81P_003247 [Neolewinella sp.]